LTSNKVYDRITKKDEGVDSMPVRMLGEKYYLTEDLVDILPIGIKTLQLYIRTGKLPGRKIGRIYYVSQVSLKNFLKGRDKNAIKEDMR